MHQYCRSCNKIQDNMNLQGLGYFEGSYIVLGSCSCPITLLIESINGTGATFMFDSGFCRTSSAKGRGTIHIPGGTFCTPFSSTLSAPAIMAAKTGVAFLRGINQTKANLSSSRSF